MVGKKLLLPAVGAAVLVAGGAAGYWYLKGPAKDGTTPLAIAKTIPQDAYMVAFIPNDLQAWAKLQQFGTPEAKQAVTEGLQNVEQQLLTKNNINFNQDVRPWLGNGMAAVFSAPSKKQDNVLVVFNIRDKVAAMQFAGKLASQGGGKSKELDYKGNKIMVSEGDNSYATVVNDFLMVASDQKTIESAINTSQGQPSLAAKPGVEDVLKQGTDVQNAIVQVYVPDGNTAAQALKALSEKEGAAPSNAWKEVEKVQSIVAGIGVEDAGLRMKATVNMKPNAPKFDYQPVAGKIVSQFPAETLALISGGNISRIWAQTSEQAKSNPTTQQSLDEMRNAAKSINLDLDKDIFGWMDGEFGMAFIPSDRDILSQTGFGGLMVFDTSDRKTAEATLAKLDTLAQGNTMQVQTRDLQGKKVTEWSSPAVSGALLGHGWLDDDTLFVALGGPMVDVITSKPSQVIADSANFKAATGVLPKPNLGYFYVDMDKTMTLANRFAALSQSPIPAKPAAVLNSIKGIGVTSTQANSAMSQMDMLVALKKG